jgi:hypothetical protein
MKIFFVLLSFSLFTLSLSAQVVPPTSLRVYNQNQGNWELGNGYEMRYHGSGKLASITEIDSIANVILSTRFFEYDSLGRLILDSTQFLVSVGNYAFESRSFEYGPNGKITKLKGKSNDPNNSYQNEKEYWYNQGFRGFSSSIRTINSATFDTLNRYIRSPFYDTLYFSSTSLGIYQKFKVEAWRDSADLIPSVYTSFNAQGLTFARDSGIFNSDQLPLSRRIYTYQNYVQTGFYDNFYSYFPSIPKELVHQPNPELSIHSISGLTYFRGAVRVQASQGNSDSDFTLQYGPNNRLESYVRRNNTQGVITDSKMVFGYGRLQSAKMETLNALIFPNPCRDFLQIQAPMGSRITITDLAGRTLQEFQYQGEPVNTESFPTGVLFITIQKDQRSQAFKLVKL